MAISNSGSERSATLSGPVEPVRLVKSHVVITTMLLYTTISGLAGCAGMSASNSTIASDLRGVAAEGVFVRRTRLRVEPFQTEAFEALIHRCVRAANAAGLTEDYDWMVYREPPTRYWLIMMSDMIDGFAVPASFTSFVRHIARAESSETLAEIDEMLASITIATEEEIVRRQYDAWSTVGGMSTKTHPKARVVKYTVRSDAGQRFSRALATRTAFLMDHDYVLPIEGFVAMHPTIGRASQVVFPVTWSRFFRSDLVDAFVAVLPEAAAVEFRRLDRELNETLSRIEYYDGDFARKLSYSAPCELMFLPL